MILHCHLCYTQDVDEEVVCERCEENFCFSCSAQFTLHGRIDYNCCYMCGDTDPCVKKEREEIYDNESKLISDSRDNIINDLIEE